MRLSTGQRSVVFGLFCLATLGFGVLEGYLIWSMITNGADLGKGLATVITGGMLAGCGTFFLRLLSANFLNHEVLPIRRLQRLASERAKIIDEARHAGQSLYELRRSLVTTTLEFAEETLRGWVPGSHFELCVFVDAEQPLLFAYFDSNHDVSARSMVDRAKNPFFYIEKGYEVTKLLRTPTSHIRFIGNTEKADTNYIFTSEEQRKQLRSTLLHCLDLSTPCAIVVTSNQAGALPETDEQFGSFIKFIGSLVRFDLFADNFVGRVRFEKPELFLTNALPLELKPAEVL